MTDRLLGTDPTAVRGGDALAVLVRASARVAVGLAAVLVGGAALVRGPRGAATAVAVAVVVVGLHWGSGVLTARLSASNPAAMPGIAAAALVLRLGVYGALVALFADSPLVDVPSLAVTTLTLTLALLAVESFLVVRYSRHWWAAPSTDEDPIDHGRSTDAPPTTPARANERIEA